MDSAPIDLPTIAEIEAATDFLSGPDNNAKVVRVRGHFAVKFGNLVSVSEADTLKYLADSNVPVPKVYATLFNSENNKTFIIMEYIPGDDLQKLLSSGTLTMSEKATICKLVKNAMVELRKIPSQGYLGTLNRKPYIDRILYTDDDNPMISGPFENEAQMNNGILEKLSQTESPQYVRLLKGMVDRTLHGHRTVFTHSDLQPKNIMVTKTGLQEDGSPVFKITLLDWESAGWYP